MRQVNLDELTYQIFSGLRGWTVTVRRKVFAPIHKREAVDLHIAANSVCAKLRSWSFMDPSHSNESLPMEAVSARLSAALPAFPGAIGALWLSGDRDREREAHAAAAVLLADALAPLEVLSATALFHFGMQEVRFPQIDAPVHALQSRWP